MLKENRGVTLVALVVTIIVLLILAGVSIAMISGDEGLLTKASEAETSSGKAKLIDAVALATAGLQMDNNGRWKLTADTKDDFEAAIVDNYYGESDTTSTVSVSGTSGRVSITADTVVIWATVTDGVITNLGLSQS